MKCLTIQQPWASLILCGAKDVENRGWPTRFRGRFAVHASKTIDLNGCEWVRRVLGKQWDPKSLEAECAAAMVEHGFNPDAPLKTGVILGVVELATVHMFGQLREGVRSAWHAPGQYGFYLNHAVALTQPIAMRGSLGFFDLPYSVEQFVIEQMESGAIRDERRKAPGC